METNGSGLRGPIREDTFHCSSQAHACLEPHCAIASFSRDGKLTVWTSTQSNYYTQLLLSDMTGLREGDIKVIKPHVGDGFGGKLSLDSAQYCASLLSMKLMRPVKIVLSRSEEFTTTKRRTPIHYQSKPGAKRDGTLVAKKVRAVTEGGAYTAMGGTALYLTGFFSSFPYKYANYQYDGFRRSICGNERRMTSSSPAHSIIVSAFSAYPLCGARPAYLGSHPSRRREGALPFVTLPVEAAALKNIQENRKRERRNHE